MTELVWEGKYDAQGKKAAPVRIALPFQTIETVNESAQQRQKTLDLFSEGKRGEWRNRLIWGDKKYVLPSLLPEFAGQVNLIYIDPPFDTGADFSFTTTIPDTDESFTKEPSVLEQKAYRDTWGRGLDSYLQWFDETTVLLAQLLADGGSLYVHLDSHVGHYAKVLLDQLLGTDSFRSHVVWQKIRSSKAQSTRYGNVHDMLLFYTKGTPDSFAPPRVAHSEAYLQSHYRYVEEDTARRYRLDNFTQAGQGPARMFGDTVLEPPPGKHWIWSQERIDEGLAQGVIVFSAEGMPSVKRYLDEVAGNFVEDIWVDIPPINSMSHERVGYPTQKPEVLLDRILRASSNEGDLVLDCFCGSGTTAVVAERLGRRWIACDLGRFAIHVSRKRLLSIENVHPFVIQNLGKYERQAWQAAEFEHPEDAQGREAAYRRFILDLYHADPVSGHTWLHGIKAGRMVHVGAVDAPVTVADVRAIVAEVWKAGATAVDVPGTAGDLAGSRGRVARPQPPPSAAVDVLGWEFAFELNETAKQMAAEAKVDATFRRIPREVLEKRAVEQGDVRFFELAALSVRLKQTKHNVALELTDFVIPPDDVPEDIRQSVTHWEQWIDYWAVDWDFRDDTFHNQWQSYRTRKDPSLQKKITHSYEEPGEYAIVVKVIDILGNDTTKSLQVKVT